MAKRQLTGIGKSRITAFAVQLEADDQTVQEGIRSLTLALGSLLRQPRLISTKSGPVATLGSDGLEVEQELQPELAEEPTVEQTDMQPETRRPRSVKSPEVVDIDLTGGNVPLAEFCKQNGVSDSDPDSKRYLVIMFWLKEYKRLAAVGVNHIYTCYRHMNWHTPKDPSQPLRDMKQKNGWVRKAEGKGNFSINHLGENEVRKMSQNLS